MNRFFQNPSKSSLIYLLGLFFLSISARSQDFTPGEILVKFTAATPDSIISNIVSMKDLRPFVPAGYAKSVKKISMVIGRLSTAGVNSGTSSLPALLRANRILRIGFVDESSAQYALTAFSRSQYVEYAQHNYIYRVDQVPSDSAYSSQWNLERIGITQLWESGFFDTPLDSIKVGVLDTGVDYLHPDLASKIYNNKGETGPDGHGGDRSTNGVDDDGDGYVDDWRGYDFVDSQLPDIGDWSTRDNDPMDENGHGTSVAGIIGAQANNGIGVAGICPVAQIVPLRAFNAAGLGTDADIAAAIVYAADIGIQVLNMSFGDVILSPLLKDVIHYAHEKNVIMVASSGNDGSSKPHYPSDFSDVISVGSISQDNVRSFFSSYSPSLALVAPGESIPTTKMGGGYDPSFSGTSAAAPHVSAIAALLLSTNLATKKTNFPSITNDQAKATLLAAADDLGDKGWDNYYGAGELDARFLLSALGQNFVQIVSPGVDAALAGSIVPVIGTASTSQLASVSVSYGIGNSPLSWMELAHYDGRHFINDTLARWNISSLQEGTYTLRLHVTNIVESDIESRVRISIVQSNPVITNFTFQDSVIIQQEYGALVTLRVNRISSAKLHYRLHGGNGTYAEMASSGIQMNHAFLFTSKNFSAGASYDFYVDAVDQTGKRVTFPQLANQGADYFTFVFTTRSISTTGFDELPATLPAGFVLNRAPTIAGKPTFVLNQYDGTGSFGSLKAFQYVNGGFLPVDSAARRWVPRDLSDVMGNGKLSTLVQDHGVTEIFSSDAAGTVFFGDRIFVDSSNVWGSQMYDFDGDGKLDLIARNSSEYLIYRNLGGNGFQLMARFENPTSPLPGDAQNQFGPPRSLVGDFSGSGLAEVIFADYDGDVLLYRQVNKQTAPFQFQPAWIDSSDLLETSDFLTAGDFNGDGRTDFAVAGHSNLDVNGDREYDPPIWRVRIFSHLSGDSPNSFSVIWDQTFYGVKAGLSYDNGIATARVLHSSNDQLILSLNPYLYIIDHNSAANSFAPVWMHPSVSNGVIASDFNGNGTTEFGFNADGKVRFFESASVSSKPQTPWAMTAIPLSSRAVRLQWSSSQPSAQHNVYRDTVPQPRVLLTSVTGTSYLDGSVTPNKTYWYAVTLAGTGESDQSSAVSTVPHSASRIDSVTQETPSQLSLVVSYALDQSRISDALISVDDSLFTTSVGLHSPTELLVTFAQPFSADSHFVHVKRLIDVFGMPADTTQRIRFLANARAAPVFYLMRASFVGPAEIQLEFNDTLSASAIDVSHFCFSNAVKQFVLQGARLDSASRMKMYLRLADNQQLTPVGYRMELNADEGVRNNHGISLNYGRGQTVSFYSEIQNLDNVMVFPNPLRFNQGDPVRDHLTFANLPERCRIDIFGSDGEKIASLAGSAKGDGLRWNLADSNGRRVSSGIYFFFATQLDENSNEVRTKTGKFAIVR